MKRVDKQSLLLVWNTYKDEPEIPPEVGSDWPGSYNDIESEFLYSIIRHYNPKKILEISPDKGRTTRIMMLAAEKNKGKCEILSYDINNSSAGLDRNDDKISRQLIVGDVIDIILLEDIVECDLLFMDSNHSVEFGQWYSTNVTPFLKNNTLVFVHDWEGYEGPGSDYNIVPPWGVASSADTGEATAVKEFSVETGLLKPIINIEDELAHEAFKRGNIPDSHQDPSNWWDPEKKKPIGPYQAINPTQILQRTKKMNFNYNLNNLSDENYYTKLLELWNETAWISHNFRGENVDDRETFIKTKYHIGHPDHPHASGSMLWHNVLVD